VPPTLSDDAGAGSKLEIISRYVFTVKATFRVLEIQQLVIVISSVVIHCRDVEVIVFYEAKHCSIPWFLISHIGITTRI